MLLYYRDMHIDADDYQMWPFDQMTSNKFFVSDSFKLILSADIELWFIFFLTAAICIALFIHKKRKKEKAMKKVWTKYINL